MPLPSIPATLQRAFDPVVATDARVLLLGSMPGAASLAAGAYYAHPRNLFWPFMADIVGFDPALPYAARLRALQEAGIGLWDVVARCQRPGSLDSAIVAGTVEAADLPGLLAARPRIRTLLFNGARAEAEFHRWHPAGTVDPTLRLQRLPSTSPANASQRPADKLAAWRAAIAAALA